MTRTTDQALPRTVPCLWPGAGLPGSGECKSFAEWEGRYCPEHCTAFYALLMSTVQLLADIKTSMRRQGTCQHPAITDQALLDRDALIAQTWGNAESLKCPDCDEYLYPHDDGDDVTVHVGEPWGAGAD